MPYADSVASDQSAHPHCPLISQYKPCLKLDEKKFYIMLHYYRNLHDAKKWAA